MHESSRRLRSAVAAAVGVECLFAVAGAVYLTVGLFSRTATEEDAAVLLAVLTWLLAGVLALLVVGLLRGRSWARGPVITVQVLALPVAWSMISSEKWYLGVILLLAALVGLTGVHPAVLGRAGGEVTPPR